MKARPSAVAKPKILVVGSSNTDMVIKVGHLPKPGETILGGEFASVAGGKGANQAVGAARAGGAVSFIARVGQDMFGDKSIAGFIAHGIDVSHVVRDPSAPSGVALILVSGEGENSIAVASGANGRLSPADVEQAKPLFSAADVVVLQLETPLNTIHAAVEFAAQANVPVILNPAPAQPLPAGLLKKLFLLTPNETEAELLSGIKVIDEKTASQAADKFFKAGVKNVIITLGARGVYVAEPERRCLVAGFKMKAVDSTGAGDVFNGTLAVALGEGKSLLEAARFANAAAAISVTRLGAQTSAPSRKEIEDLLGTQSPRTDVIAQAAC